MVTSHITRTVRPNGDELTGEVLKSIPELLDPGVGHHLVFTVEEVSLMVCKLLVEGVSFPQTGIQSLMDPGHQHRLENHKTIHDLLLSLMTYYSTVPMTTAAATLSKTDVYLSLFPAFSEQLPVVLIAVIFEPQ